jgi:hypothetical protein
MIEYEDRPGPGVVRERLLGRLAEEAPGRLQLLTGPRQVGKTTLLLGIAEDLGPVARYAACDGPEASLPGWWEGLWTSAEETVRDRGRAVLLLDEIHAVPDWASHLKGAWDRLRRRRLPVHVVATGSSALRVAAGSRESLAGRFERTTLGHWGARDLVDAFGLGREAAADLIVRRGAYPGAYPLLGDPPRWTAYVRDAILEPALGRDLLALRAVRRPGLLRQVFAACAAAPARILSLEKIRGSLRDGGSLGTVAHYLALLEEAYLVAPLPKHSGDALRRRAAPPKIVLLSNALAAALEPLAPADPAADPVRFAALVENACLAHAWNRGQRVAYWREEPLEVDGVLDGSWGKWAIEVKTGRAVPSDLRGLREFCRRYPAFRPLVVGDEGSRAAAAGAEVAFIPWRTFLLDGPPPQAAATA